MQDHRVAGQNCTGGPRMRDMKLLCSWHGLENPLGFPVSKRSWATMSTGTVAAEWRQGTSVGSRGRRLRDDFRNILLGNFCPC